MARKPKVTCTFASAYTDQFIVPPKDLPPGYDTVASFTAKFMPVALGLMLDPETGFMDEERDLMRDSAEAGAPPYQVPAAPYFQQRNVTEQPAFQVGMLLTRMRLGVGG